MSAVATSTKRTEKKKHIKAVQQKKRLFRSNDSHLSVLMWGVNHTISEMSRVNIPVMLMPDEFKAFTKIRIDNHMFNKDNMPSHFKFKECCPLVFRNLRDRFGIGETCYLNSLTKRSPVDVSSPGRSGARFLTSYDRRFVIKTIPSEEVAEMHRILKLYHQYIVECHAKTLLPQYLGMYRITINDSETYFIIMRNVFSPRIVVHKKYDLKGSSVDRMASEKERSKEQPTFKDNDFVNDKVSIEIHVDDRQKLMKMLEADTQFLTSLNLMDYSLLVGIHDCEHSDGKLVEDGFDSEDNWIDEDNDVDGGAAPEVVGRLDATPPDSPSRNQATLDPAGFTTIDPNTDVYAIRCNPECARREIYFMALIDVLTVYGVKKRTAQAAKTMKHGSGAEISTVRPDQYARRFLEFIDRNIK